MNNINIIIVSLPRSGSSMLASLIQSAGYNTNLINSSNFTSSSEFNRNGYFEEVRLTLLNDQLIRLKAGKNASNLFVTKEHLKCLKLEDIKNKFQYDLDEKTVFFPDDFSKKIEYYTGKNWDVWGISRMIPGGKWYKAYSKYEVESLENIKKTLSMYEKTMNSGNNLIMKDPRLGLVLDMFNLDKQKCKFIRIKREKSSVLKSMKNHYGSGMFTSNILPGSVDIVSNHFNYKIRYQCFDEYEKIYNEVMDKNLEHYDCITVDYDLILAHKNIKIIEDFIGSTINRALINNSLYI
jgi:hypothetical protein